WGFFLDASRISQQQIRSANQVDKRNIVKRFDQPDIGMAGEVSKDGLGNVWVGMNRIYDLHIGKIRDFTKRQADILKTLPETLASMSRHHDQLGVGFQIG